MQDLARPLFPADTPRPVDTDEPGQIVITADVPWPVWDRHAGVVVMPATYTQQEQATAMVALVRERSASITDHGAVPPVPLPRRPYRSSERLAKSVHALAGTLASVDEHLVDARAALARRDFRAAGYAVEAAKRLSHGVVEQAQQVLAGGAAR